jgi:cephalosporin hydroxylase
LRTAAHEFMRESTQPKYSYNFSWLGRPIIQYPQDIVAMQELIWALQPDLIIETGIAHGGSLILWASLLELNAACGGPRDAHVIGVDIDIRAHNRAAIGAHRCPQITMIEDRASTRRSSPGSGPRRVAAVLVCLDSNHTTSTCWPSSRRTRR